MKTYLTVYFSSEGAKPSTVTDALLDLGFKATRGPHDFVYEWADAREVQDLVWFADKVHAALEGNQVLYKLETVG